MLVVLVSHSYSFASEAKKYVLQMLPKKDNSLKIKIAAGNTEGKLGSDIDKILNIINNSEENNIILIPDIGSSMMNSQLAMQMSSKKNVVISSGSFFEGFFNLVGSYSNKMSLSEALILSNQEIEK